MNDIEKAGDAISREYLKEQIPELWSHDDGIDIWIKKFDVEDLIDNAPKDRRVEKYEKIVDIVKHWNDEKCNFVAACEAFEKILDIINVEEGDQ